MSDPLAGSLRSMDGTVERFVRRLPSDTPIRFAALLDAAFRRTS